MKIDFCQIKNSGEDTVEVYFYGDIVSDEWSRWGKDDVCPSNIIELTKEIGNGNVNIHINSGGGDVFAGFAIYNILKNCKGKKTVYIDGLAASIASVIAMAGDEIIVPENAYLMIHNAWTVGMGNSADMRKLAETLDTIDDGIVDTYLSRTCEGIDESMIREYMSKETWFRGSEIADIFNNIRIDEPVNAVASISNKFKASYINLPNELNDRFKNGIIRRPDNANVPAELMDIANYAKCVKAAIGL